MHLVQLYHPKHGRRVAWVQEPHLQLINGYNSTYAMAWKSIRSGTALTSLVKQQLSEVTLDYDPIYEGASDWHLLPPFDHPENPHACLLTGTGLTHKASAENRNKMHEAAEKAQWTDSMKMYQWGVEGGHPETGRIGVQPEWFYKGTGNMLRAHGHALEVPSFGDDGGEEPEIAGLYLNDEAGTPWRIGLATANEFSDHVMERKNYLYLAPSKIRTCSLGPELVINADFKAIQGTVRVIRNQDTLFEQAIRTGEAHMAHSLANLEYHHFKYDNHRLPGQAHIHFFGADAFSFGAGIQLQDEDLMEVHWQGFGRPLKNVLMKSREEEKMIIVPAVH